MEKSKSELIYKSLLNDAQKDENILGVILAGSRARTMETENSDWDMYIIFKNTVTHKDILQYQKMYYAKYKALKVDMSNKALQTIDEFSHYAEIDTKYYYDRYNLVHAKVEVDKTDGQIRLLLEKINTLTTDEQKYIIDTNLGEYITHVYRSIKSYEVNKETESALDAAESLKYLLTSLFALNQRVRPFNKYLEWELTHYPLKDFAWKGEQFAQMLLKIIKNSHMKTQQDIYIEIEKIARDKGFGYKYDVWREKLQYVTKVKFLV